MVLCIAVSIKYHRSDRVNTTYDAFNAWVDNRSWFSRGSSACNPRTKNSVHFIHCYGSGGNPIPTDIDIDRINGFLGSHGDVQSFNTDITDDSDSDDDDEVVDSELEP